MIPIADFCLARLIMLHFFPNTEIWQESTAAFEHTGECEDHVAVKVGYSVPSIANRRGVLVAALLSYTLARFQVDIVIVLYVMSVRDLA